MSRWLLLLSCCLSIVGCTASSPNSGIKQIIETRDGQRSVWGVTITVSDFQFNQIIPRDQLAIMDDKYDRDITEMMTWSVDEARQTLRIVFKPGDGDFGSGNVVHVLVNRSALSGYTGPDQTLEWSVPTDPL